MTQSFWESGNVVAQQLEEEMQSDLKLQPKEEFLPEVEAQPVQEQLSGQPAPAAQPETLILSVDEFSALEERILRAVNLVKRERLGRAEAEERAAQMDAQLREQTPLVDRLQTEVKTLRVERDHVRQRVERLLSQLDALEL